jgi:hypothetical protein
LENDYTQYDSTISKYALETEFMIYKAFGVKTTDLPIPLVEGFNWAKLTLDA